MKQKTRKKKERERNKTSRKQNKLKKKSWTTTSRGKRRQYSGELWVLRCTATGVSIASFFSFILAFLLSTSTVQGKGFSNIIIIFFFDPRFSMACYSCIYTNRSKKKKKMRVKRESERSARQEQTVIIWVSGVAENPHPGMLSVIYPLPLLFLFLI